MSEELHQKISQFLDNELEVDEALHLLHTMQHKSELHHKMQRYQAISHALTNHVFLPIKTDFSARIAQAIHEHEEQHGDGNHFKLSWIALAASIAVITVLALETNAFTKPAKITVSNTITAQQTTTKPQQLQYSNQYALNRQINQYLLLHHNDVDTATRNDVKTVGYPHK